MTVVDRAGTPPAEDTAGVAATTATPPALTIGVDGVAAVPHAALPTLEFTARVRSVGRLPVRSLALNVQIRIATGRRPYGERDRARLAEILGGTGQQRRPAPSLLWTRTTVQVPAFAGEAVVRIPVACTYDFEVVATKYLHAVTGGQAPLEFLFSGSVFYSVDGRLQVAQLPWDTEAEFRMPVAAWQDLMEQYFPGTAYVRLDRDTFDALYAYRSRQALPGWTDTVQALLRAAGER